jgi:ribosomal protein S18 acetylase RimI-like enzyme
MMLFKMETQKDISFKLASTAQDFKDADKLFHQYADVLTIDLSFQDFENELKSINLQYNKPNGALILSYAGAEAVGCVALRSLDGETAELKRMFVQAKFQGQKIGQRLLEQIFEVAKELHYKKIRLDTLSTMKAAQHLYRAFGFYEIAAYRFNPIEGAIYMEKILD